MFAVVTPEKIQLPPGSVLQLKGNWLEYQALIEQLGDRSIPRIKYRSGEIILMSPLPQHGRGADVIAYIVKELLDYLGIEYTSFTPITMQLPEEIGIEPDYCFYIDNWAAIAGKDRINWGVDPAPDLAIEIDVTSYTNINDYLPDRVPEIWLFKQNQLLIYGLVDQGYSIQTNSRYFPNFNVSQLVGECLQMASDRNTSTAIRQLRQKLVSRN